jgi:hypothetical protein
MMLCLISYARGLYLLYGSEVHAELWSESLKMNKGFGEENPRIAQSV